MNKLSLLLPLFMVLVASFPIHSSASQPTRVILPNGFEAILIENHSNPVISSVITVRTGSANETIEINGISHMLEHLLFNGTNKRSQEELYKESDYYGIYVNAHTGKNFTNYIALAARENAERILDIQADMLFQSIFPEHKFKKEKGIILNEIVRDISQSYFFADEQFTRKFFRGTPYNLPVLGIQSSVSNINRKTVIEYYKSYYVPNNMTALIIGDFDALEMANMVDRFFGAIPPGKIPEPPNYKFNPTNVGIRVESKLKVQNSSLTFGMPIPSIEDEDYYSLKLLGMLFNTDLKHRISTRLKKKGEKAILSAHAVVDFNRDFGIFMAEFSFSPDLDHSLVENAFMEEIKDFAAGPIDDKRLKELLTATRVKDLLLYEKPHYYGMMKAKSIAVGGWEFTNGFLANLEKAYQSSSEDILKRYFKNPVFFSSLVTPGESSYEDIISKIEKEYYSRNNDEKKFTEQSLNLTKTWTDGSKKEIKITPPINHKNKSQLSEAVSQKGKIRRRVLDNALTLIINSNSYSKVFAIHLLAKNRSLMEPEGKTGIADFLHRLLRKGTAVWDGEEMNHRLTSIGAVLKTHDNPYIPYDDYYTTHDYSYIRFETVDRFFNEAVHLFSQLVVMPRFQEKEIEQVREEMLALVREERSQPRKRSGQLFNQNIFGKLPRGKNIMGTEETISSITLKDIQNFHKLYFSPKNLVISVATSTASEEIIKIFNKTMGSMRNATTQYPKSDYSGAVTIKPIIKTKNMSKPQSYIKIGKFIPISKKEKPALTILGSILHHSLSTDLREKQGIAYSLGAGFNFYDDYALLEISVGTIPATLKKARDGILNWLNKLPQIEIKEEEITRIANRYISRDVMRNLTRINQCYILGLEDFNNFPTGSHSERVQSIKSVTPQEVKSLAEKYLGTDNLVQVIVD